VRDGAELHRGEARQRAQRARGAVPPAAPELRVVPGVPPARLRDVRRERVEPARTFERSS